MTALELQKLLVDPNVTPVFRVCGFSLVFLLTESVPHAQNIYPFFRLNV